MRLPLQPLRQLETAYAHDARGMNYVFRVSNEVLEAFRASVNSECHVCTSATRISWSFHNYFSHPTISVYPLHVSVYPSTSLSTLSISLSVPSTFHSLVVSVSMSGRFSVCPLHISVHPLHISRSRSLTVSMSGRFYVWSFPCLVVSMPRSLHAS